MLMGKRTPPPSALVPFAMPARVGDNDFNRKIIEKVGHAVARLHTRASAPGVHRSDSVHACTPCAAWPGGLSQPCHAAQSLLLSTYVDPARAAHPRIVDRQRRRAASALLVADPSVGCWFLTMFWGWAQYHLDLYKRVHYTKKSIDDSAPKVRRPPRLDGKIHKMRQCAQYRGAEVWSKEGSGVFLALRVCSRVHRVSARGGRTLARRVATAVAWPSWVMCHVSCVMSLSRIKDLGLGSKSKILLLSSYT